MEFIITQSTLWWVSDHPCNDVDPARHIICQISWISPSTWTEYNLEMSDYSVVLAKPPFADSYRSIAEKITISILESHQNIIYVLDISFYGRHVTFWMNWHNIP